MRLQAVLLIPALLGAQTLKPDESSSIGGKILNSITGESLNKATVTLRQAPTGPPAAGTEPVRAPVQNNSFSTSTDASGNFVFKDLEPGSYLLTASRSGFVTTQFGARTRLQAGTPIKLGPRENLKGLVVRLAPHGVISGRVTDADNDPVESVLVNVLSPRYVNGSKQLSPVGQGITNDRGEYRIFGLAAGKYYLSANSRFQFGPTADRSANPPSEANIVTYYPGTADSKAATTVEVSPGRVLQNVDVSLIKARTARVRGRVMNETGFDEKGLLVIMTGITTIGPPLRSTQIGRQGQFEFQGIAPGRYDVMAAISDGTKSSSARQMVEISSQDVEDLSLTLARAADVTGEVRAEGSGNLNLATVRIGIRPSQGGQFSMGEMNGTLRFGITVNAQVDQSGKFVLPDVSMDRYTLAVTGLPGDYYLKSTRLGDSDALTSELDLTHGARGPLVIVVSAGAGRLSGKVTDEEQKPVEGGTVVVIPDSEKLRTRNEFVKTARTDKDGQYSVRGLAPGAYKVYAWQDVDPGAWMDPDFVKAFESKSKALKIGEGVEETADIKVIAER